MAFPQFCCCLASPSAQLSPQSNEAVNHRSRGLSHRLPRDVTEDRQFEKDAASSRFRFAESPQFHESSFAVTSHPKWTLTVEAR